jgi:hypothetical protein
MNEDLTALAVSRRSVPPITTMLLAIVAPFAAIALMATPLVLDAARQAVGS